MRVLVTGCAGFVGSAVATNLLSRGDEVVGVDNLNDYYNPALKQARLSNLRSMDSDFQFLQEGLEALEPASSQFEGIDAIVHLGAQAGVRYSIDNPQAYISSNLVGFANILELARLRQPQHVVYASSSSVYGANTHRPFSINDHVNHPVSLYAATKRSNELMAQSYSSLYEIPMTGLRFFTVYGPWGRPDMAYFSFTERILNKQPIRVFGDGLLSRDFTFIDDIVSGVIRCLDKPPSTSASSGPLINETAAPHRVFNLGNGSPVTVNSMIDELEAALGVEAIRDFVERQQGDVDHTLSDISDTREWCGYKPTTSLAIGIPKFVDWYQNFYKPSILDQEVSEH